LSLGNVKCIERNWYIEPKMFKAQLLLVYEKVILSEIGKLPLEIIMGAVAVSLCVSPSPRFSLLYEFYMLYIYKSYNGHFINYAVCLYL